MPRVRLTDEEREARRKERARHSFSDAAYSHYNPRQDGYGSTDEWIAAAEAIAGGATILTTKTTSINPDLVIMHLTDWPADIAGLKRAFRNSLFLCHPDYGGSNEATRELLAAFERLSKFYK